MNRIQLRQLAYNKLMESPNKAISNSVEQDNPVIMDVAEYIGIEITGQGDGTVKVAKPKNTQATGVQSFNSNKLEAGEHMVIDSMKGEYALETADAKEVETAHYIDSAPADLMNADVVVKQGSTELIRLAFSEVHNPNTSQNNEDNYRVIGHMPILEAEKPFSIELEFPDGTSLPAGDHFVRFEFRGHKFKK